jgi:aspartyl-tRNA(Asn)/glutamyl-tRNA(Gln) amidotransferase subunit C
MRFYLTTIDTNCNNLVLSILCVWANKYGGDFMSRLTLDQVKHVAHLARLAITEDDAVKFQQQLDKVITYAEQLNELDTTNVEPTSHVLDMKNVFREDVAQKGLPVEDVVKNAPDHADGQIRVPAIIE